MDSDLTLSCTVSGEGKFSWTWSSPQSPAMVMTSDFTRTSTSVFTNISIHDGDPEYKCSTTYDPVIIGASFAMTASQEFTVDFQCKLCVLINPQLTLSAHAPEGYSSHLVCLSVCPSVCQSVCHFFSNVSYMYLFSILPCTGYVIGAGVHIYIYMCACIYM